MTELNVLTAILDSSHNSLSSVRDHHTEKKITAVEFLSNTMRKYVGDIQLTPDSSNSLEPLADQSSTTSIPWKKAKQNILMKLAITTDSTLTRDIQQYRCISVSTDNLFDEW